jgi:hypothetical protein
LRNFIARALRHFRQARGKIADMDCNSCIASQMPYLGFDAFSAVAVPFRALLAQALSKFP